MKTKQNKLLQAIIALLVALITVCATATMSSTAFADLSLDNYVTDGMIVETADASFTFDMGALFAPDKVATTYSWSTDDGDTWYQFWTSETSWYSSNDDDLYTYTFTDYGSQDIWFKCEQGEATALAKIHLIYYQGSETPSTDAKGYYEIYSYQQLKAITSESSAVSVKLMDNISIYDVTITSGSPNVSDYKSSWSSQLFYFLNGITEFDGNDYTITYAGTTAGSDVYFLKTSDSGATIKDLTIDCNGLVQGLWVDYYDVALENVEITHVASNGYALKQGIETRTADIYLSGTNEIGSVYAPKVGGYIYNYNTTDAFSTQYTLGTASAILINIPASGQYPTERNFAATYYSYLWYPYYYSSQSSSGYQDLNDTIAGANLWWDSALTSGYNFSDITYLAEGALLPTTTTVTGTIWLWSDLTFNCEATTDYGITIGDGGVLEVIGVDISVIGDGQAALVQSGGTLMLWDGLTIDSVTVQGGGTLYLWGDPDCDYPTYENLTLNAGAIVENDSDIAYTVTYNGTVVTIPAGETYVAGEYEITYATTAVSKTVGNAAFTNALTIPTTAGVTFGTVAYTSSDETVATVDADGEVTIVGAGTAVIIATATETDTGIISVASYTLTVSAASSSSSSSSSSSTSTSTTVTTDVVVEDTVVEDTTTTTTTTTSTATTSTDTADTTEETVVEPEPVVVSTVVTTTVQDDGVTQEVSTEAVTTAIEEVIAAAAATVAEDEEATTVTSVVIDLAVGDDTATDITAALSSESVTALVEAGIDEVVLAGDNVSITIDAGTLATMAESLSGSIKIVATDVTQVATLSEEAAAQVGSNAIFTFSIEDEAGNKVSDFNGGAITVSIPYVLGEGESAENIVVYYIDEDGNLAEAMDTVYDAAAGMATFTTTHFSTFAVVHLDVEEAEVEDLTETGATTDTTEPAEVVTEAASSNVSVMLIGLFVVLALLGGVVYFVVKKRSVEED